MRINIYNKKNILLISFIVIVVSMCLVNNCYCFLRTKLNEESRSDSKRPIIEPIVDNQEEEQENIKNILIELKRI